MSLYTLDRARSSLIADVERNTSFYFASTGMRLDGILDRVLHQRRTLILDKIERDYTLTYAWGTVELDGDENVRFDFDFGPEVGAGDHTDVPILDDILDEPSYAIGLERPYSHAFGGARELCLTGLSPGACFLTRVSYKYHVSYDGEGDTEIDGDLLYIEHAEPLEKFAAWMEVKMDAYDRDRMAAEIQSYRKKTASRRLKQQWDFMRSTGTPLVRPKGNRVLDL